MLRPPSGVTQFAYNASGSTPGTPWSGGAVIQAEDFDAGGDNVADYDTTTGNAGGYYRASGTDIGFNIPNDRYFVGWTKVGDWTEYTINVPAAGTYRLQASVASQGQGGTFAISANGSTGTATGQSIVIPDTGSFATYQTVSSGTFTLAAGTNVLRVTAASDGSSAFYLGDMDSLALVQVAAPPTGGIAGTVFNDANGNGAQDAGESGLSGWQIFADTNGNGVLDAGEPTATSAADGTYTITGLAAGSYTIIETPQPGYTGPATGGTFTVTVAPGQTVTGQNFGNTPGGSGGGGTGGSGGTGTGGSGGTGTGGSGGTGTGGGGSGGTGTGGSGGTGTGGSGSGSTMGPDQGTGDHPIYLDGPVAGITADYSLTEQVQQPDENGQMQTVSVPKLSGLQNDTQEITLGNLPPHESVSVGLMTFRQGDGTITLQVQGDDGSWKSADNGFVTGNQGEYFLFPGVPIAHTGNTLKIKITGAGFTGTDTWGVESLHIFAETPAVSITADRGSVNEGDADKTITYTVTRSTENAGDLTIPLAWSGTAGASDTSDLPQSVKIKDGDGSATFTVDVKDDSDPEWTESLIATLQPDDENRYGVWPPTTAEVDIADNDAVVTLDSNLLKVTSGGLDDGSNLVRIDLKTPASGDGTATLSWPSGILRIWKDAGRSQELQGDGSAVLPNGTASTLYAEAVSGSNFIGDILLRLNLSDPLSSQTATSQPATAVGVNISVNGQQIGPGPLQQSVLIGQGITVTASAIGPATISSTSYKVQGDTFKSYTQGSGVTPLSNSDLNWNAVPVPPMTATPDSIHFYYLSGTESGIAESINAASTLTVLGIGSVNITQSASMKVYSPIVSGDSVSVGHVGRLPSGQPNTAHVGFGLLGTTDHPFGMTHTASISLPGAFDGQIGSWYYTQLLSSENYQTLNNIGQHTVLTGKGYYLDAGVAYMNHTFPTDGKLQSIGDNPHDILANGVQDVEVADKFKDYLIFVAPGGDSIPVPLRKDEVEWNGSVYWNPTAINPTTGDWVLNAGSSAQVTLQSTPTTEYPTWTLDNGNGQPQWVNN